MAEITNTDNLMTVADFAAARDVKASQVQQAIDQNIIIPTIVGKIEFVDWSVYKDEQFVSKLGRKPKGIKSDLDKINSRLLKLERKVLAQP